jgi:hypothetical protein
MHFFQEVLSTTVVRTCARAAREDKCRLSLRENGLWRCRARGRRGGQPSERGSADGQLPAGSGPLDRSDFSSIIFSTA